MLHLTWPDRKFQYTSRFKTWNLQKNSNSDFWKGIGASLKRKQLDVSDVTVYFNDDCLPLKKLKKELQRYAAPAGQSTDGMYHINGG